MEDIFDKLQAVTGISKYSNSEVITPKPVVSDIVDLLPADVFSPESKFLDMKTPRLIQFNYFSADFAA